MKIAFASFVVTLLLFVGTSPAAGQAAGFVSVDDAAKNALKEGAGAPQFALKDSTGKMVRVKDLLKQGNIVLVFYRGSWCPFCNTYLRKLQTRLADIKAAGGQLVAVSVENPDASMAIAKKNELTFTVLSDPNLVVARGYGLVYQMPPETDERYKKNGLDVARHNAMEKPELPLAATYIIDKRGKIFYSFIETDYKKRAEPDVIIENLSKLGKRELSVSEIVEVFNTGPNVTASDADLNQMAIDLVRKQCVDFIDDGTNYWVLRMAGATDELINEVDKCMRPERRTTIASFQRTISEVQTYENQKMLITSLVYVLHPKKDNARRNRMITVCKEYIKRYERNDRGYDNAASKEMLQWIKEQLPKLEQKVSSSDPIR